MIEKQSRGPEDEDGHGNDILDGGSTPDGHFPRNEVLEDMVRKSFSHVYEHNDHLVFGSSKTDVDISALHPEQVHIFRFWQVYLENVDPLLKITHTLTLQARIINAVGNMRKISPTLEALMFSIYCISVLSLTDDECVATFATPREDLLKNYRFGCQQALFNCKFLRSRDQDCLTALYLYLVSQPYKNFGLIRLTPKLSVKSDTAPQSLSPMLGAAIRIAQRMGLHNESSYARCTPFEAEMRRRLWWALVVFDHRMCEMSDHQASMLIPTWDCKTPLNVNDSDLRPDMKHAPTSYPTATESLYAVVCSELADHLRHCDFHLDFSNPSLKTVARALRGDSQSENDSLSALGKRIEEKYLRFCNPEIPLHFMTTWWARGVLAKNQLIGYWSRFANSSMPQDSLRDNAVDHALRWIECDTQLKTSSLTQGFLWLIHFYFPFPSAVYVVQELRRRPAQIHGKRIWEVLDANYEARFKDTNRADNLFTKIFAGPLFAAWAAYEAEITQDQEPPTVPLIVMDVKRKIAQARADAQEKGIDHLDGTHGTSTGEFLTPISVDFGAYGFPYNMGGFGHDQQTLEQNSLNFNMNYFDWGAIKWNPLHLSGW